jgi:hypothetical protein
MQVIVGVVKILGVIISNYLYILLLHIMSSIIVSFQFFFRLFFIILNIHD